ncbi:site-specific DNA-methyltransferase [Nocardioides limicola]|uniref:site-specific DNA-methyltransferase n=1 Tax=Nocardioides limicola TaxID=2803368 RepID=UPI00193C7CC6|nr:site-specific DNA-methyltransferase [Nocardioides sp. DJM-14]
MADEGTSILDVLVNQVEDASLRSRIAREIELLRGSRSFGLVFDRHLPESVRLPEHPIRKGVRVALSDESSDETWPVLGFTDKTRKVAVLGVGKERPVDDLIVIREFGEPVYPGLESVERIQNGPNDAPWHTVINGENFHALQALRSTHRDKVDLIYIDPPYNTGGKTSWLYNDKFVDRSDRAKSSKWLSFMERRLKIARDLLKDSGAIFVSIGDDEQHRLRLLMDQVFGPDNCVNVLTVEMSTTSGPKTVNAQQGTIVKNCEFVLIYRKSSAFDDVSHTPLVDSVEGWAQNYSWWLHDDGAMGTLAEQLLADEKVAADIAALGMSGRGTFSMNRMSDLLVLSDAAREFVEKNVDRIARTDRLPVSCRGQNPPQGRYVRFHADHREYILTTLSSGTEVQVLPLSLNYRWSDDHKPRYGRTVLRGDLWKGFFKDMARVDREGGIPFNNGKKPIRLIQQLVRWANNSPDAVIVDFFAGSGSTAHAVMEMNSRDGGRRQCILVTNNEVGIDQAKALRKKGLHPGDPEWESQGVFQAVTTTRIKNVLDSGAKANVEFFNLTYLDPGRVRRGHEYEAVAPLMWLEGGARGERVDTIPDDGWALTDSYGVLFTVDELAPFADAVSRAASEERPPAIIFVITDSPTEYQQACERLPVGIETVRLYQDYLSNYTINIEGGAR